MKTIETLEKLSPTRVFKDSENFNILLQFLCVCRFMPGRDTHVIFPYKFWYNLSELQDLTIEIASQDMHEQRRLELENLESQDGSKHRIIGKMFPKLGKGGGCEINLSNH